MFGFLNVNKPKDWTSRGAVDAINKLVKPSRVGHAGTLDPLATGVLVVCVGPATRLAKYVQAMPKAYVADFRLGLESDTEDIFGTVLDIANAPAVTAHQLTAVLPEFVGEVMQLPPKFSALKLNGKRAYQLARKGKEVNLEPRPIQIYEIRLESFDYPNFRLSIRCGSGTYVRSIGRDIGQRLGTGAVMTDLQRTSIGGFGVSTGISPKGLSLSDIDTNLIAPQDGLPDMPRISVPAEQAEKFSDGHAWTTDAESSADEALAVDASGRLLTILKKRSPGFYTPAVNFSKYWLELEKHQ